MAEDPPACPAPLVDSPFVHLPEEEEVLVFQHLPRGLTITEVTGMLTRELVLLQAIRVCRLKSIGPKAITFIVGNEKSIEERTNLFQDQTPGSFQ